jgi:formylglycine-generating enzyme required for sulfatase activity
MATLFVSHCSEDDAAATAVEAWLRRRGFTDVFVDHSNIAGGEKWEKALRDASSSCRVVVCLVTQHWLASDECFGEFKAAWYMGKRIIPLLALTPGGAPAGARLAKVLAEDQGINIVPCVEGGQIDLERDPRIEERLESGLRAAGALARIGHDPEAFAIDRKLRPTPFPGLASFGDEDADAALFYGRSREIAETLEELRKVRAERDLRPFVILGASGAGKSSLLKAGIIPRLRRESPAWLPLRAFRPGADPLLNFAEALTRSLADFGKIEAAGVIRDCLFDAWLKAERRGRELTPGGREALEAALEAEGRKLRQAAARRDASILISVDQAEEMARMEGDSGEALADYLRTALTAASRWQLAFTIRTDSFPELQRHRRFQDLQARGYDLRAVPVFRFDSVVEEPAKRYGVEVATALVDRLVEDAPREDALPLLAFALQRLWRQYAASGVVTQENYIRVGGLRGLIEDAAERALHGLAPEEDVPRPSGSPPKQRVELGASTFVPALAQMNDQGATIGRIAPWASFSSEQQELLVRFDQWRLVVRKGTSSDGGTAEVAHEALFREWTRLKGWLEPERARLESLRSLQSDALAWDRNRREAAFLNHREKRLAEAKALIKVDSYRKRLGVVERDYLANCEAAEQLTRGHTRRRQTLIGVLALCAVGVVIGWVNESWLRERLNWFTTQRPYARANVWPYVLTAETEHALRPLGSFRECARNCPEMIVIPAGDFMMGSAPTEYGRKDNEGPLHKVTIARPLAVSKFLITFAEFDLCSSLGRCIPAADNGFGRDSRPVINIDWDEAKEYVDWLSELTGRNYRLLTEAEWEYAARAGSTTAYYWGDEIGEANANCDVCGSRWDGRETSPVGSFKPNGFSLYDMAGNVQQWVEDCKHEDYNGAPADGSAWISGECSRRMVRGGSSDSPPELLRSAWRYGGERAARYASRGFRVARTLAQ